MRSPARVLPLTIGLLVTMLAGELAAGPPPPFTIAVVRRDGTLIPFAQYAGRKWKTSWPVPGKPREVPLTLADVPSGWWGLVPRGSAWVFWPIGGDRQPITLTGPRLFYPHCQTNVGLGTSYLPPEPIPPPTQHHHPKDGLAIAGAPIPVEPVVALGEASPEWTDLSKTLWDNFNRAEEAVTGARSISAPKGKTPATVIIGLPAAVRLSVPVQIEVLCRSRGRQTGTTVFYIEAVKRYTPSKLGLMTFFSGFVHMDEKANLRAYLVALPTSGEHREVTYTTPLGMIRIEETPLWVVQRAGFGWEEYAVVDVSNPKPTIVIATFGGGC